MSSGRLITIEGIDGAGKTTLARSLATALGERGVDARLLREPGGVPAAERIRQLVQHTELEIGARTEALLYAAARAQLLEQAVIPLLEAGTWVLLDRFVDSSLAYQGAGRELGIEAVQAINDFATGGVRADRTLLMVIDPELSRNRWQARNPFPDRLEREHEGFFDRVASAYAQLARADADRIRCIDASQPPEQVLTDALRAISDLVAAAARETSS